MPISNPYNQFYSFFLILTNRQLAIYKYKIMENNLVCNPENRFVQKQSTKSALKEFFHKILTSIRIEGAEQMSKIK